MVGGTARARYHIGMGSSGDSGGWKQRLKGIAEAFQKELAVYRRVLKDGRTPRLSRWLLALAVGYALLPIDLIPDVIPVIGHLDDLIVVPLLVIWALKGIPEEVIDDARRG